MDKRARIIIGAITLSGAGFVHASPPEVTPPPPLATPIHAPVPSPLPPLLSQGGSLSAPVESTALQNEGIFINNPTLSQQTVELFGQGSRPVDNTMVDRHSIYQNKNTVDPTEFGAGIKINATEDFSISIEAGGELETNDNVDIDSGAVKFSLSY